jgi:hypothetical protein
MTIPFPALRPTSRQYTPPKWPVTGTTSQSGVTSRRLWGSAPSQGSLSLAFNNRPTTEGVALRAAYNDAKGPIEDINLPSSIFEGDDDTYNEIQSVFSQYGLRWYFTDEQPAIESVVPGICNMRVNLVAELRLS